MPYDPSKADKRTKEYKDWAAKQEAKTPPAPETEIPVDAPGTMPDVEVVIDESHKEPVVVEVRGREEGAKKPTRPWERMNEHRPFRRDYFALKRKHAGFRPRFVDPKNVEGRIERGYQVAKPEDYGGLVDVDVRDTSGLGSVITRHGMVLMEIPEEGAQAYERYNEDLIKARQRSNKEELEKEAASVGTKVTPT
jgi:hypothetical protein